MEDSDEQRARDLLRTASEDDAGEISVDPVVLTLGVAAALVLAVGAACCW